MKQRTLIIFGLAAVYLAIVAALACSGVVIARGAAISSVEAHFADGSTVATTAPSVLTATANAIAATRPVAAPLIPATHPSTQPATPPVVSPIPAPPTPPAPPAPAQGAQVTQITTPGGLNAIKWTGNRELVLNGSGTFTLNQQTIALGTSIYIHSADSKHPATISIPATAPWTINDNGSIKVTDCHVVGGAKATFVQSHGKGNCDLENLTSDGACLFWGEGGNIVTLTNCTASGSPANYAICNFDAPLASLTINGGSYAQGKNQAAIRLMEVTNSLVENCTFVGSNFKQCVQDRSGGNHLWKNVTVKVTPGHGWTADIGPMSWEDYSTPANTPQPLALSEWINCTLPDWPQVERPGNRKTVQRIVYQGCTIDGEKNVNKDFN